MSRQRIIDIITTLFVFLFVYTAVSKLLDFDPIKIRAGFVPVLRPYAAIIGIVVPIVELLTVLLLVSRQTQLSGLIVSLVLMVVFTGYIGWMLFLEGELPCSCGGVISRMTWPQHFWFNVVFILLGTVGVCVYRRGDRV